MGAIFRSIRVSASAVRFAPMRGVLGSAIPSTGQHGAAPAYKSLNLPSDASNVYDYTLTSSPAGTVLHPDLSVEVPTAADGSYTLTGLLRENGTLLSPAITTAITVGAATATPVAFAGTVPPQSGTDGVPITALSLAEYFSGSLVPFAYVVSAGSLPPGLSLNAATGLITGAPTAAGDYAATVRAMDAGSNTATTNAISWSIAAAADAVPPAWSSGADINVLVMTSTGYTAAAPNATDAVGVTGYRWRINGGAWTVGQVATVTGRMPGTTDALEFQAFDAVPNYSAILSKDVVLPAVQKRVRVRLTTDGQSPAASLTGLSAAFFDAPLLHQLDAPSAAAQGLSTDSDGYLVLDVTASALPVGGIGYLVEGNSNGDPGAGYSGWHGPVAVEAA